MTPVYEGWKATRRAVFPNGRGGNALIEVTCGSIHFAPELPGKAVPLNAIVIRRLKEAMDLQQEMLEEVRQRREANERTD